MAVVIDTFEVLPAAAPQPADQAAPGQDAAPPAPLQPDDLRAALQALQQQALRLWAH